MSTALERGIYDGWSADAGISALISTRLYPVTLPDRDRSFPAATYQVISAPRGRTQEGDNGSTTARVQFRLYAETYTELCNLRDAVIDFCKAHQSPISSGGISFGSPAVCLSGWLIDSEQDDYAGDLAATQQRLFSKRMDIIIFGADLA